MAEDTVIFFTGRPPEQILVEGGTQSWVLNARRVRKCQYAVLVQNRYTHEQFSPTEPHHTAFMVGLISSVDLSEEQPDPEANLPERYIVRFKRYARISIADAWNGARNPVGYFNLREDIGINPDTLDFLPMPAMEDDEDVLPVRPAPEGDRPLSIAQAKAGLSLTFGVPPESVEITIRG